MLFQRMNLDTIGYNQYRFNASLSSCKLLLALFLIFFWYNPIPAFATFPVVNKITQKANFDRLATHFNHMTWPANTFSLKTDSILVDSTVTGLIPALSYSTEVGIVGGLIWSKFSYSKQQPFKQNIALTALASTKGLAGFNFFLDQFCSFNCADRLILNLVLNRFLEDQYYGVYTNTRLNLNNNPKRFEYHSFTMKINLEYRMSAKKLPLKNETLINALSGFLSTDFYYKTPWSNDSDKLIMLQQPSGYKGAHGFWLGIGGLIDTRDSEFYPNQGWYSKQHLKSSLKPIFSDFTQSIFLSDTRFYHDFKLIIPIVFAQRISYQWSNSNSKTPYWSFPSLGGEEYLRGYLDNRFLVPQFWATNTELRTWLLDLDSYGVKIGGTLFLDAGSYTNEQTMLSGDWSDNLKYTAGLGGLVTLFSPDFILRVDLGLSEEGYGIFFSTGILF